MLHLRYWGAEKNSDDWLVLRPVEGTQRRSVCGIRHESTCGLFQSSLFCSVCGVESRNAVTVSHPGCKRARPTHGWAASPEGADEISVKGEASVARGQQSNSIPPALCCVDGQPLNTDPAFIRAHPLRLLPALCRLGTRLRERVLLPSVGNGEAGAQGRMPELDSGAWG